MLNTLLFVPVFFFAALIPGVGQYWTRKCLPEYKGRVRGIFNIQIAT